MFLSCIGNSVSNQIINHMEAWNKDRFRCAPSRNKSHPSSFGDITGQRASTKRRRKTSRKKPRDPGGREATAERGGGRVPQEDGNGAQAREPGDAVTRWVSRAASPARNQGGGTPRDMGSRGWEMAHVCGCSERTCDTFIKILGRTSDTRRTLSKQESNAIITFRETICVRKDVQLRVITHVIWLNCEPSVTSEYPTKTYDPHTERMEEEGGGCGGVCLCPWREGRVKSFLPMLGSQQVTIKT